MKIKTMTASFGRLEGEKLELGPGLNIIQAPNEGGKSTWAGFLKAMLYGIDTRDRDKKGHIADKNRYQPWSGAPMEGELTLEWGGREVTIRRGKQGNTPFGAFSAVYTGTQEPVPGLSAESCGELLTGVGREVYERSAFIGQNSIAISSTPELERRIAALASSGEEDVSFSQAQGRLREWLNRRRVNKTVGLIPKLERELDENSRALSHLEQVTAAIAQGEEERKRLEAVKQELEQERLVHQRLAQRDLNQRFAQAQQEYQAAQEAVDSLRREQARFGALPERELLKRAQGELQYLKVLDEELKQGESAQKQAEEAYVQANIAIQDPNFNGMTGEEAQRKAEQDVAAYQAQVERGQRRKEKTPVLLGLAALCLILGLALAFTVLTEGRNLAIFAGAGTAALLAAAGLACAWTGKGIIAGAQRILSRYGTDTPEQVTALAQDYVQRWEKAETAAQELKAIRAALNDRKARRENGRSDLLSFVHTFAPEVSDLFGCSAALSRALGLEDVLRSAADKLELTRRRRDDLEAQGGRNFDTLELIAQPQRTLDETQADLEAVKSELARVNQSLDMAKGEQKAVGDPAALAARQEQLREQLERRSAEYQALTAALEALTAANARLQERFSPELNQRAGEWMDRLTGGKYPSLSLNKDLEVSATQAGGLLPRKSLTLSRGTVDQLYLAVRLAVCQLCLPQQDPAPLVLDDALVSFDDWRMALALDCLAQLGQQRQILLFTCQGRESQAMKDREHVKVVTL